MTANEDAIDAVVEILDRSEYVRDWPEDERDLHRNGNWTSFTERHAAVVRLRAEKIINLMRSRASIGPDSERIREAEQVVTFAFADVSKLPEWMQVPALGRYMAPLGELAVAALRAAGLLPGPDDIVVSREALQDLLDFSDPATQVEAARSRLYPTRTRAILRAALSQPHPESEGAS